MDSNSKEIDWAGVKFEIMKDLGECIDILFIKVDKTTSQRSYFLKPHNQADGISALISFLEYQNDIVINNIPKVRAKKKPNIFKRFALAVKHVRRQSPVTYKWSKTTREVTGISPGISFFVFESDITSKINLYCKSKNINSNSLLIWAVDSAARKLLKNPNQRRSWMVPVNLRQSDDTKYKTGNHVTTLTIILEGEVGPIEVHHQVKQQMSSDIMWGGQIVANSPKYIGVKRLKKMATKIKSPYIGLCSNIGTWPLDDIEIKNKNEYQLIVSPPSTMYCPIALSIMTWDDQLSLSIQLHPSICDELSITKDFLNDVIHKMVNYCEISDTSLDATAVQWKEISKDGVYY